MALRLIAEWPPRRGRLRTPASSRPMPSNSVSANRSMTRSRASSPPRASSSARPGRNGALRRRLPGMVLGANGRAGLLPPPPLAADADGDARNRQRPADTESERDDDRDTGLGASLALSVIKESAIAELARNVTSGGAVVLSASGTPFVRARAGAARSATRAARSSGASASRPTRSSSSRRRSPPSRRSTRQQPRAGLPALIETPAGSCSRPRRAMT